jgi:formamidopyrimidine-DNA glycosylase
MPELPEVENVVRSLRPSLEGRTIGQDVQVSPLMVGAQVHGFRRQLPGQRIERIDRHGKWIFVRLRGDRTLVVHLGMTGHLSVVTPDSAIEPHTHLRLPLDLGSLECRFVDPRRFGEILLLSSESMAKRFGPDHLGIDALQVGPEAMIEILSRTRRSVKSLLLDQRAIAGIGNIYADEILFATRIHPAASARALNGTMAAALAEAIGRILKAAIRAGGSTIRDYADSTGRAGSYQLRHLVYGRADQPCRQCNQPIAVDRTIVSGRSTHFCPNCQVIGRPGRRRIKRTRPRASRAIE